MGYVALQPLRWGEEEIAVGEPVPAGEPGRDYDGLLYLGHIAEASASPESAESTAERDDALAQAAAVEKLRLDDLARAERAETDLQDANDRATEALTERDEALAALDQVRKDMEGVVDRQAELAAERDDLAKQLEEATAPTPEPESKPVAAKKPATTKK